MPRHFRRLLLFTALLPCAVFAEPNLPHSVEAAHAALASATLDTAQCATIARDLSDAVAAYPTSSLCPEALHLATELCLKTGNQSEAQSHADKLIETYPQSEFAPDAFDVVWNYLTTCGQFPGTGGEAAKNFALALQNDTRAAKYFTLAFHGFAADGRWKEAAEMGERFLTAAGAPSADPTAYLTMSEVALRLGNTALARQSLEIFTTRFSNLPQMVIAHNRLGHLQTALGHSEQARAEYSTAWSLYQKNAKRSAYGDAAIAHAAAEALWTLQTSRRSAFEQLATTNPSFSESTARKSANTLRESCEQIAVTDPQLALQAYSAMGDVSFALSKAIAANSLRKLHLTAGEAPSQNPLQSALDEASRAVSFYQTAFQHAASPEQNGIDELRDRRSAAQYAAERAFEALSMQGDWQYDYANRLLNSAPQDMQTGGNGVNKLNYFVTEVLPVATKGYEFKARALTLPSTMPLENAKAALKLEADEPLKEIVRVVSDLCITEWRRTSTSATQLASTVKFGLQTSTSSGLVSTFETNWNRSETCASRTLTALVSSYDLVASTAPPSSTVSAWNELILSAFREYTTMSGSAHLALTSAATLLPTQYDTPGAALRNDLNRLAATCGNAEYRTLVQWHDLSSTRNIEDTRSQEMAARLAELDPQRYGSGSNPSASRKSP